MCSSTLEALGRRNVPNSFSNPLLMLVTTKLVSVPWHAVFPLARQNALSTFKIRLPPSASSHVSRSTKGTSPKYLRSVISTVPFAIEDSKHNVQAETPSQGERHSEEAGGEHEYKENAWETRHLVILLQA